jgi:hypothetical protein
MKKIREKLEHTIYRDPAERFGGGPSVHQDTFHQRLGAGGRIFPGRTVGVDIVGQAECISARLILVHGVGTLFFNSSFDPFIDKIEISAQRIGLRRCNIVQGGLWG